MDKKASTPPEDIPRVKLQPVDVGPAPAAEYKTIPTVQRELLTELEDVGQNRVVLEELDPAALEWKGSTEAGVTGHRERVFQHFVTWFWMGPFKGVSATTLTFDWKINLYELHFFEPLPYHFKMTSSG